MLKLNEIDVISFFSYGGKSCVYFKIKKLQADIIYICVKIVNYSRIGIKDQYTCTSTNRVAVWFTYKTYM